MSEWEELCLGEVLRVKHGFAFRGEFFSTSGSLVVLTPGNFLETGGFKEKSGAEKYYDGPVPRGYLLEAGDVVVAMTEQSQGLLGSSATIPRGNRYLHNQRIGLLEIIDAERLNVRFAYHLFNTAAVRAQIQATATGSKVRHTAPDRLHSIRAVVPSRPVQTVIASILDSLDTLTENNRRRVEVLEEMARAIYREWFVHFRYPGSHVAAEPGVRPEDWSLRPCSELASYANGFAFRPEHWGSDGRPIIKIRELKQGVTTATPRCSEATVPSRYRVEHGDLLFSWSADLGVYRWAGEPGLLNQHLFKVESTSGLGIEYLRHSLAAVMPEFRARAQGTTMKHIKRSALSEVRLVVPPDGLAHRFEAAAGPLVEQASNLRRQSGTLESIRDLLLSKLLSGEIDVSSLELDALVESSVA